MFCTTHSLRTALRAAAHLRRQQLQQQPLSLGALRLLQTSAASRSDAIPIPQLDGEPKKYSPKIQQLVKDIASLTLLEVSDLNELLKKTLNIQDVGVMPMAGAVMPAAQAEEVEAESEKVEKTRFIVRLTEFKPEHKIKLIKEVKNTIHGMNLVQAKKVVESLPHEIRSSASKEEAEKLKAALEEAGGTVVVE